MTTSALRAAWIASLVVASWSVPDGVFAQGVYKCTGPQGVMYQQRPCAEGTRSEVMAIDGRTDDQKRAERQATDARRNHLELRTRLGNIQERARAEAELACEFDPNRDRQKGLQACVLREEASNASRLESEAAEKLSEKVAAQAAILDGQATWKNMAQRCVDGSDTCSVRDLANYIQGLCIGDVEEIFGTGREISVGSLRRTVYVSDVGQFRAVSLSVEYTTSPGNTLSYLFSSRFKARVEHAPRCNYVASVDYL